MSETQYILRGSSVFSARVGAVTLNIRFANQKIAPSPIAFGDLRFSFMWHGVDMQEIVNLKLVRARSIVAVLGFVVPSYGTPEPPRHDALSPVQLNCCSKRLMAIVQ